MLCRVLRAGASRKMRSLHGDPRIHRLAGLCEVPMELKIAADEKDGVTLLWKQPGVDEGLGDLPWHRDCGLGGHASQCPTAVVSVFLGPNTPEAGDSGFAGLLAKLAPVPDRRRSLGTPRRRAACARRRRHDPLRRWPPGLAACAAADRDEGPLPSCVPLGFTRVGAGITRAGAITTTSCSAMNPARSPTWKKGRRAPLKRRREFLPPSAAEPRVLCPACAFGHTFAPRLDAT
ncbi:MAG: hypothetical protein R3F21_21635 [Myxococcota bacterium]